MGGGWIPKVELLLTVSLSCWLLIVHRRSKATTRPGYGRLLPHRGAAGSLAPGASAALCPVTAGTAQPVCPWSLPLICRRLLPALNVACPTHQCVIIL
jgi:hypothetical protein